MPHSCSKSSPPRDRPRRQDGARNSSITPQRKHRKLLKDGSGSEVWPEGVEKIFVQGSRAASVMSLVPISYPHRPSRVLGVTVGDLFPRTQSMAQSISSRLLAQCRYRPVKKASGQPHASPTKHVEGRARSVPSSLGARLANFPPLQNFTWWRVERSFSPKLAY
jgi:hypothetical protein